MIFGDDRLTLPSNAECPVPQLRLLLREAELVIGREITLEEWARLS